MRFYKDREQDEIHRRYNEGGTLWFIEKVDTGMYHYIPVVDTTNVHSAASPFNGAWTNTIDWHTLTGAFLTEADATTVAETITEGGCDCCGSGSTPVITNIIDHTIVIQKED